MKILEFIRIFIIFLILFSILSQPDTTVSSQVITSNNIYHGTELIYNDSLIFPGGYPIFLKAI